MSVIRRSQARAVRSSMLASATASPPSAAAPLHNAHSQLQALMSTMSSPPAAQTTDSDIENVHPLNSVRKRTRSSSATTPTKSHVQQDGLDVAVVDSESPSKLLTTPKTKRKRQASAVSAAKIKSPVAMTAAAVATKDEETMPSTPAATSTSASYIAPAKRTVDAGWLNGTKRVYCFPPPEPCAPHHNYQPHTLICGSMTGGNGIKISQMYGHPQNAYWKVLGVIVGYDYTQLEYEQRIDKCLQAGVIMWNVLASCIRKGSLDTAIKEPVANDIAGLLKKYPSVHTIGINGGWAHNFFEKRIVKEQPYVKHLIDTGKLRVLKLISTSPAAAMPNALQVKTQRWIEAFGYDVPLLKGNSDNTAQPASASEAQRA